MQDTKSKRKAVMTDNENSGVTTDNRVLEITIESFSPIITGIHADRLFSDSAAMYGQVESSGSLGTIADTTNTNAIVDPDDLERFVFIGQVRGLLSLTIRDFYFDMKYKDIIALPELSLFGATTPDEFGFKNKATSIAGEAYGYTSPNGGVAKKNFIFDTQASGPNVQTTQRSSSSETIIALMAGIEIPRIVNRSSTDAGLRSDSLLPIQLAKFTFTTPVTFSKATAYTFYQDRPGRSVISPLAWVASTTELILPVFH